MNKTTNSTPELDKLADMVAPDSNSSMQEILDQINSLPAKYPSIKSLDELYDFVQNEPEEVTEKEKDKYSLKKHMSEEEYKKLVEYDKYLETLPNAT